MNTYAMVINGRSINTVDQDAVINPAFGEPFATCGMALVQEIESGTGWVNHHLDITPFAPFGGAKWSGIGHENGRWGYNEFTEMQVINAKK